METGIPWKPVLISFILLALCSTVSADFSICTSYTNENGQHITAFSCHAQPFCCGNLTYKHCCDNCSQALDAPAACQSLAWDPTYTIVQCVVVVMCGILVCTVGILAFNGSFDPKPIPSNPNAQLDWPERPPIDPVKGYPVQPSYPVQNANPVEYEPGDNDLYPVHRGARVYTTNGQLQVNYEATENDNLIAPEQQSTPTKTDPSLAKTSEAVEPSIECITEPRPGRGSEQGIEPSDERSDTEQLGDEDSSSVRNSPSSIIVSVKPRAPSPPAQPV